MYGEITVKLALLSRFSFHALSLHGNEQSGEIFHRAEYLTGLSKETRIKISKYCFDFLNVAPHLFCPGEKDFEYKKINKIVMSLKQVF